MPASAPHQAIKNCSAFLQLPATGGINKQPVSKRIGTEHYLQSSGAVVLAREASGLRVQPEGSGKEPGSPGGPRPLQLPQSHRPRPALPAVPQQAKFAFYRCSVLLRWRLQYTLFCTLAWEKGLSARHFLWNCLVRARSGEGTGGWPPGPWGRPALAPVSDRDVLPR